MTTDQKPVITIPKEKAVFRLDKNGVWHKGDEKFTNQKIISHFHSIIKKDNDGYYLEQEHSHFVEKVYFPYEDTPLFVVRMIENNGLILCLNTGEKITLDPEKLFVKNDDLYVRNNGERIKFHADALISLSAYLDCLDDQYAINLDGKRYLIPVME